MGDLLFYIAAFIFVIALIVLAAWLWRALLENGVALPGHALFTPARDKRIGRIETASIDSRRKLVLIRRDNVEHLIMTGGPVDVVIETSIVADDQIAQGAAQGAAQGTTQRAAQKDMTDDRAAMDSSLFGQTDESLLEKRLFSSGRRHSGASFPNDA